MDNFLAVLLLKAAFLADKVILSEDYAYNPEGRLFKIGAAWRELQSEVSINPNVSVVI